MKRLLVTLLVSMLTTLPIRCEDVLTSNSDSSIIDSSISTIPTIEDSTINSSNNNETPSNIEDTSSTTPSIDDSSTSIFVKEVESLELVNSKYYSIPTSYKLQLKINYNDESYEIVDVNDDMIEGNIDYSVVGNYPIEITYENMTSSFVIDVIESRKITLSSTDSISGITQYSTGNYVSYTKSGESFQFYRANRNQTSTLTSILPEESYVNAPSLPGAVYNKTCIDGIVAIDVEYKSVDEVTLQVGNNRVDMESISLPSQDSFITQTIIIDSANFFALETNDSSVTIKSINIYYSGVSNGGEEEYIRCNEGKYRLNPVVYEATLTPGVSYVDVPIDITVTGDSYTVNETKRYTYYTYDYVSKNPSIANEAALIEPMDVANYFIAFKTYPANYVVKKSYSTAKSIFKENTRCVSDYSRTNGYATSVPYRANISGNPHYFECDIALSSSYSSSNRGTGRLVVWEYGFTGRGYDESIVAVYTDDHYASFAEYLNNGRWGDNFNAEFNRTCYSYGSAYTLN